MQNAFWSPVRQVGYMYELGSTTEEEAEDIFQKECLSHEELKKFRDEVVAELQPKKLDIKTLVKAIYTYEHEDSSKSLYKIFNKITRQNLKTFFDWHEFSMKGIWLVLYQEWSNQQFRSGKQRV